MAQTSSFRTAFRESFLDPDEDSRVEPEEVTYETPDGEELHGTLWDSGVRPSPAVVMLYSPILHVHDAYKTYAQFLVRRGYTAFHPHHSLSGMEEAIPEFAAAGRWLKDREWIDEDRVAVYGQSAGGHDVYFQLSTYPGLWKAGIVWAGVADMIPLLEWGHIPDHVLRRLGDPYENDEHWWERSPITHLDNLEDPLLILHGTADEIVPASQPRLVHRKLTALGFEEGEDYEFDTFAGMKHGDHDDDGEYKKWRRIDEFLEQRV
ncbi:alpha/beta hydrolase family protein [Halovivax gelatinilyticus]|uniref:alpha/beta hydrolase family protein n=1 Tax=Halovivax gelatinilyticus TaxID=2961597 RepID=UPI0020CA5C74|nr:prolyl oligopeptidase family serine peptidase [Halovivax gelatinilyticus]